MNDPLNIHADYLKKLCKDVMIKNDKKKMFSAKQIDQMAEIMAFDAIKAIPVWLGMIRSGELSLSPEQKDEILKDCGWGQAEMKMLDYHLEHLIKGLYDRAAKQS